jgi:hypothetical protein
MKFKLLVVVLLSFIPAMVMAQPGPPPGVNTDRYNYCMNEGLGKGRSFSTPENYCGQWAGPSAGQQREQGVPVPPVPCGMTWNGNPIYMSRQRCEAYISAERAQELAAHKAWLVQQAAAAAAAAAAAKNNGGAIYNCAYIETSTPANGGGYPPIQVPYTGLGQPITANSLNLALAKAGQIAKSSSIAYWVVTASCTEVILLKNL